MDEAFEAVPPGGEPGDVQRAACREERPRELCRIRALGHRGEAEQRVQDGYAAAAEVLHLGDAVRLAAFVDRDERLAGFELELAGGELPPLCGLVGYEAVRLDLGAEVRERRLAVPDARPRPDHGVERRHVAVVEDVHARAFRAHRARSPAQHGKHDNSNDPESSAIQLVSFRRYPPWPQNGPKLQRGTRSRVGGGAAGRAALRTSS